MLNTIRKSATSYVKDAAIKYAQTSVKKAALGSPKEVQLSVDKHVTEAKNDTNEILSRFLPMIQKTVLETIGNGALTDIALEKALRGAYLLVPGVVRLVFPEEKFIAFLMEKKATLFASADQEVKQTNGNVNTAPVQNLIEPPAPSDLRQSLEKFGSFSKNNHKIYENLVPELIAFCIVSNGVVQDSEVKMAVSIINNDQMISNKRKAMQSLSAYIKINMDNKRNAQDLFDLSQSTLMTKIGKLESTVEKERVNLIIESMLSSIQEITVANSQSTASAMRNALA